MGLCSSVFTRLELSFLSLLKNPYPMPFLPPIVDGNFRKYLFLPPRFYPHVAVIIRIRPGRLRGLSFMQPCKKSVLKWLLYFHFYLRVPTALCSWTWGCGVIFLTMLKIFRPIPFTINASLWPSAVYNRLFRILVFQPVRMLYVRESLLTFVIWSWKVGESPRSFYLTSWKGQADISLSSFLLFFWKEAGHTKPVTRLTNNQREEDASDKTEEFENEADRERNGPAPIRRLKLIKACRGILRSLVSNLNPLQLRK